MAQIQTYPRKTIYDENDLILICDKTPDGNGIVTNDTKTTTISTIADNLDVVKTLNSLKGNINITGGTNITVTPSGQNIEISTSSSNVDGSGTANTIPKWSDSNTLTDSPFTIDTSTNSLDIPTHIRHIGDTDSQFGFQTDNHFRVQTGGQTTIQSVSRTDENGSEGQVAGLYFNSSQRFFTRTDGVEVIGSIFMPGYIKHLGDNDSLFGFSSANNFIVETDSGRKIAAGPDSVTLYSDTSVTDNTTSFNRLAVNTTGVTIYGQTAAAGAPSDQGGLVKYYSAANNRYVGISGPTTTGTNYILRLPDSVGTADQVLKLPSTPGTTSQLVWGDATGGSTAATSSNIGGIKLFSDIALPAISSTVNPTPASKNYGVQINSLGQAGVHVPWENTTDITLTTTGTSGAATWNGTTLNIPNYASSSAGVQSLTVTQGSGTGLDYVSISSQSTATGNVNLGFVNLTAANFPGIPTPGVEDCRVLIKDNYWANLWPASQNFIGGIQLSSATVQAVAPNAVSSDAGKTYSVQLDSNNKAVVNVPWVNSGGTSNLIVANQGSYFSADTGKLNFTMGDHGNLSATSSNNGLEVNVTSTPFTGFSPAPLYQAFKDLPNQMTSIGMYVPENNIKVNKVKFMARNVGQPDPQIPKAYIAIYPAGDNLFPSPVNTNPPLAVFELEPNSYSPNGGIPQGEVGIRTASLVYPIGATSLIRPQGRNMAIVATTSNLAISGSVCINDSNYAAISADYVNDFATGTMTYEFLRETLNFEPEVQFLPCLQFYYEPVVPAAV